MHEFLCALFCVRESIMYMALYVHYIKCGVLQNGIYSVRVVAKIALMGHPERWKDWWDQILRRTQRYVRFCMCVYVCLFVCGFCVCVCVCIWRVWMQKPIYANFKVFKVSPSSNRAKKNLFNYLTCYITRNSFEVMMKNIKIFPYYFLCFSAVLIANISNW